ncbi:DUF2332 domain-containing protein [Nocardia sp. alder85J]|uniref:DUF2332 domain-containing protein n=1 Tax=Nocardia sp. alder85J TaxID=2862949 RepID=UPI001CD435D3|nr:DUF2332 domain-containing protein [Nocardia sp. alder85J]MCX4096410.1 DUF2332 domain-containing protein [Nocardia sp. alder85J]
MDLDRQFDLQARACERLGSPLYAALLRAMIGDIRDGGPCATVLTGYEQAELAAAVPLRLLAAVHALALSGAAPELAAYYPSAGGRAEPGSEPLAWKAFRDIVATRAEWIRNWLTRPPQTNEVGRAVPLLAGLLAAVDTTPLPIRLLELGSSAGLNLRADHFRWLAGDLAWGPEGSPVTVPDAWQGPVPDWLAGAVHRHPRVTVVERRGCDPTPLDPARDALALRAYVWPDQVERFARLDGALRVAAQVPAEVIRIGAADFLAGIEPIPGVLTVVWHSVMRQYVPAPEWAAVTAELDRLAATTGADAGFAHIAFEPQDTSDDRNGFRLTARLGQRPPVVLARAKPHGVPAFVFPGDEPEQTAG